MVKVVHREQTEISMDYVNQPDVPKIIHIDNKHEVYPGQKLFRGVAVGFGLLCVLQVILNISFRLALSNQTSIETAVCKNVTTDENKLGRLTDEYLKQGWVYFHSSYYYISSTEKSWQESRDDCLKRNADLVIINTKEEQDFVGLFYKLTWIGLYNKTGQWEWVDETPLTESYWGPGEPNNLNGLMEQCVEIRFHGEENSWNDNTCTTQNFWICEKNVAP